MSLELTNARKRGSKWLREAIDHLQNELLEAKKDEATATPEGKELDRELRERAAHNARIDEQALKILRARELEAARRVALARIADEWLKKHGWPKRDDPEFVEALMRVHQERDLIASVQAGGA
jgi:transposase-like protein